MRNYIRYIVILVLIIAGGLLIISVVNRFTDPGTEKIDNSAKTEEKETKSTKEPTLDIEPTEQDEEDSSDESQGEETTPDTNTTTTSNQDTQPTPTMPDTSSQESAENNNVIVPNTGTKESMIYTILGLAMITGSICFIRKYQTNTK